MSTYYTHSLDSLPLTDSEKQAVSKVMAQYQFRANDYYLSLINWEDPDDPIRRIIVPHPAEARGWGALDPSSEGDYTVMPGLQHKYADTAIMLANDVCGGLCRFCFRKRIFMEGSEPAKVDVEEALRYIEGAKEITNVLVSGGDPLLLSTRKLEEIICGLSMIPHVQFIRIGSRMPVFDPYRIINDPELVKMLGNYSRPDRKIYIQTHFNHPNEMTDVARKAIHMLQRAGVILTNQTPLLRGVNDDPEVLADLFNGLARMGVPPYYLFVCRPTTGNHHFTVPIEEGYAILQAALRQCSGPAKRARFCMSHATGKIEVLGVTADEVLFRRHRAPAGKAAGQIQVFPRNPRAVWLDDYLEAGPGDTEEAQSGTTALDMPDLCKVCGAGVPRPN
ncbi:KamA family radical SAM protein [Desulfovibrio mangrovi]|uniref:KamA family radical SAM protein n=1 Tax=Desulfovibrio mangrovi TaxID=2976983 RepID=UPI002247AEC5|nr:KamA family radical SAM protein [Desulfovibrio mangrovi]UZP67092.1 KamA family radical SAM protein [Desulfovibrio mangrovi]